jgi:hypothetical protein
VTEFADWRYDGKEWDKERGSLNNVDSPDVQTDTSLSDLILNPDAVAMPPTIIGTRYRKYWKSSDYGGS